MMEYYLPILAFHIIAVMSWMALLFYMPRLFVYHQEHSDKKEFVEVVKIQEYKIYKIIGFPAMIATIVSGITLIIINPELLKQPWFHAKLTVVLILIAYSLSLEYFRKQLEIDECNRSGKFFRAYNEVPTLLAILIVTYVILKDIPVVFSIGITLFFAFIIYMIMKPKKEKEA